MVLKIKRWYIYALLKSMGHDITVIIEGLNELEMILEVLKRQKMEAPNVGLKVRLHSGGSGVWAKVENWL